MTGIMTGKMTGSITSHSGVSSSSDGRMTGRMVRMPTVPLQFRSLLSTLPRSDSNIISNQHCESNSDSCIPFCWHRTLRWLRLWLSFRSCSGIWFRFRIIIFNPDSIPIASSSVFANANSSSQSGSYPRSNSNLDPVTCLQTNSKSECSQVSKLIPLHFWFPFQLNPNPNLNSEIQMQTPIPTSNGRVAEWCTMVIRK